MPALKIESVEPQLEPFLRRLLELGGFKLSFLIRPGQERSGDSATPPADIVVNFSGPDTDLLLQRGGELLAALEDLALRFLRLRAEERLLVAFDCDDFKTLRVEELRLTAQAAAERVESSGRPFALNPMDARERRIIHLSLKENPSVRTESQGFGPHRQVVIFPAD